MVASGRRSTTGQRVALLGVWLCAGVVVQVREAAAKAAPGLGNEVPSNTIEDSFASDEGDDADTGSHLGHGHAGVGGEVARRPACLFHTPTDVELSRVEARLADQWFLQSSSEGVRPGSRSRSRWAALPAVPPCRTGSVLARVAVRGERCGVLPRSQ